MPISGESIGERDVWYKPDFMVRQGGMVIYIEKQCVLIYV